MAEVKFPTEVVDLPSRGLLYPKDSVLSSGTIEVKYMTAREEDILTSVNLIKKGLVIDKLLQSLIVDKSIKLDDLLLGDKNAILIASRILAYGKEYIVDVEGQTVKVDLTTLKDKFLDESLVSAGVNEFEFELPATKRKLTFKLLTSNDETAILSEVKGYEKIGDGISRDLTTRLKHQILSVDGDTKKTSIDGFVDNEFLSIDSIAFRSYVSDINPDVDMSSTYTDPDGNEKEFTVPMTVTFLWPST
mgnify:FL=1|jgi:hypothetical protein|tara:strand:+ start:1366 stop:2106 length:741 start_codon:yes stop_codon:yes gene_type:complete